MREINPSTGRRKTGRPATIDRDVIAAAALTQIERLSIARVAGALGVGASSLYHHVSGREELILLAADAAASELDWPVEAGDWREYLRGAADALFVVLREHAGLALALQELGSPPPRLLAAMRTGIAALVHGGFAEEDAALAISLVGRLAVDAALLADAYTPEGATGLSVGAPRPDAEKNMHDKLSLVLDGLEFRRPGR
jgi:AcrR family transcriptional regulator